jgi:outer membrane protein assembly factor BamB
MTVRSVDGKVVVKRTVGPLPPPDLIVKDDGKSEVFTRIGDLRLSASAGESAPPKAPVGGSPSRTFKGGLVFTGNWPGFRGPAASGLADGANLPTTWDVEKGMNVQWKIPIPGLAHSSPVVWSDRVFVTTAVSADEEKPLFRHGGNASSNVDAINRSTKDTGHYSWRVYALDRRTGKILWERVAHEGIPRSHRHVSQTQANSTPATDGRHLVVWFGSEGLFCYDYTGKLLWKKDLGPLRSGYIVDPSYEWNLAASPVIYKDRVILQVDLVKNSFIAAFDIKTGKEIWRTQRDEVPSWTTPLIYQGDSRTELVTAAPNFARGYDPDTGKELWRLGKHSIYSAASPIAGLGLIFVSSGSGNTIQPIYAIRPGANGNITLRDDEASSQYVAWSKIRGGAYLPSPILYDDLLYISSGSIVAAYRAETGDRVYQERLGRMGGITASPVAADGKLYFASEDGEVVVVKAGPKFERLAVNHLGDVILSSPAVAPGMLIYRTQHYVVALSESKPTQ